MNEFEILDSVRSVILDEAKALNHIAKFVDSNYFKAVELIKVCQGKVVMTGVGKSGHVARKIAATLSSTGTLAVFLHPAEALHGDLGIVSPKDVVVAIGKSGESEELNALLPAFKRIGVPVIAITASPQSHLARAAQAVLYCGVDREACIFDLAPTSSTTAAMAIGDALAITLMKIKNFKPEDFALYHPGGKLGKRLLLRVSDIMIPLSECPILDAGTAKFEDVIALLGSAGLGIVIFSKNKKTLDGIITDGDVRRILNRDKGKIFELRVTDHINSQATSVTSSILAVDALAVMENRSRPLNVLPVIDDGELKGLVRLHELVKIA